MLAGYYCYYHYYYLLSEDLITETQILVILNMSEIISKIFIVTTFVILHKL
jgi:hypothetical protein